MLLDNNLYELLQKANGRLKGRTYKNTAKEIRRQLEQFVGFFLTLKPLTPEEINSLSGERPVVAVDGSVNSAGASFPHVLYLFQAYAKSSSGGGTVLSDILCPLLPEHYKRLSKFAKGENLSEEYMLVQAKNHILTTLELQAAMEAVKKYRPWLVLFDGGFMRFTRHAPAEWENYCLLARSSGILSVGVIEEAESFGLSRALGITRGEETPVYDRELLFGIMEPGECFLAGPELEIKSEFYTVFARLSRSPQATAYDFIPENADDVVNVMRYLYTITPSGSRGVPLFLDMVDAEVRITRRDMELLLSAYLDAGVREKFFVPHRQRRDY